MFVRDWIQFSWRIQIVLKCNNVDIFCEIETCHLHTYTPVSVVSVKTS